MAKTNPEKSSATERKKGTQRTTHNGETSKIARLNNYILNC